ncbi:MAG: hypothetical protein GF344_15240 [Chitinivibrionales bacterium]|nr:hypothetical protein [Chitinivibrionales bacterium]
MSEKGSQFEWADVSTLGLVDMAFDTGSHKDMNGCDSYQAGICQSSDLLLRRMRMLVTEMKMRLPSLEDHLNINSPQQPFKGGRRGSRFGVHCDYILGRQVLMQKRETTRSPITMFSTDSAQYRNKTLARSHAHHGGNMGYRVKLQEVRRSSSGGRSYYLSLPAQLRDAVDAHRSEEWEWSIENKNHLVLSRVHKKPMRNHKKST